MRKLSLTCLVCKTRTDVWSQYAAAFVETHGQLRHADVPMSERMWNVDVPPSHLQRIAAWWQRLMHRKAADRG